MTIEYHMIGEVGTEIVVDTGSDISSVLEVSIKVQKPDNTEVVWDATVFENRYIVHVTESTDFDQAGFYMLHSYLKFESWEGLGEAAKIRISPLFGY